MFEADQVNVGDTLLLSHGFKIRTVAVGTILQRTGPWMSLPVLHTHFGHTEPGQFFFNLCLFDLRTAHELLQDLLSGTKHLHYNVMCVWAPVI